MSLAELLPAVQALTREEKRELVRIVNDELEKDVTALLLEPGVVHHTGYGLHDEASFKAAEILHRLLEEDRSRHDGRR